MDVLGGLLSLPERKRPLQFDLFRRASYQDGKLTRFRLPVVFFNVIKGNARRSRLTVTRLVSPEDLRQCSADLLARGRIRNPAPNVINDNINETNGLPLGKNALPIADA